MKLRVRSLDSDKSFRIEIPNTSSLQELKQTIYQELSSSSSSSPSLHLSLNRKDELQGTSPQDSLQSLGIISGDLIFYTSDPNRLCKQALTLPIPVQEPKSEERESLVLVVNGGNLSKGREKLIDSNSQDEDDATQSLTGKEQKSEELEMSQLPPSEINSSDGSQTLSGSNVQKDEALDSLSDDGKATMDADGDEDGESVVHRKSVSVPSFLNRALGDEVGGNGSGNHKFLVTAVHAVLLESGFVCLDAVLGSEIDSWASSTTSIMTLRYTLPDFRGTHAGDSVYIDSVAVKFQILGKFVNIYGSLPNASSGYYRVCLDEHRYLPSIHSIWTKAKSETDNVTVSSSEREVFEFWKIVKDNLALPLLVDLCEKAGFPSPPCLMRLPADLKLRILELLPGTDIAKMGLVCSEFFYLSSNNDLWKQKFVEEFGVLTESQGGGNVWKQKFASFWQNRRKTKRHLSELPLMPYPLGRTRSPFRFGFPGIVGGDYDRLPFGLPHAPFRHHDGRSASRLDFSPPCNLGGRNI